MLSCGVRHPSVCKHLVTGPWTNSEAAHNYGQAQKWEQGRPCDFTKTCFFYANGCIVTKLTCNGPQMGLHPGCAQGQSFSRANGWWNLHAMVPYLACMVKGNVIRVLLWCHKNHFFSQADSWSATTLAHDIWNCTKNRFFSQANGCILTKLSLSLTFPSLCPFGFLPHPNLQMAVSLCREYHHSWHGETVCQTVCYTVRSDVLSLRALTLWSTITLSFHTKYQATRSNVEIVASLTV